ncbi:hypothetical protein STCU_11400 [Strigomonas culicis]|uniref:Uncharacterized protein n=1 Tax=Strigomonas culicis TaxID=28005 RepID=S9TIW9_9TRYP|nr:hypothetical protein STCU_11400 [Strigomonas culicis]|eukprot:EPY16323.1 hypothetical protein STCU_11400 [Strigomonas culicis]
MHTNSTASTTAAAARAQDRTRAPHTTTADDSTNANNNPDAAGADRRGTRHGLRERPAGCDTGEVAEDGDLLITRDVRIPSDNGAERYEEMNQSFYSRTLLHRPLFFSGMMYVFVLAMHLSDLGWYYFNATPRMSTTTAGGTASSAELAFSNAVRFWKRYDDSTIFTSYLVRWDAHVGLFALPAMLPFLDLLILLLECVAAALFSEAQEALLVSQYAARQQQQAGMAGHVIGDAMLEPHSTMPSSGGGGGRDGCWSLCRAAKRKLFDGWTSQLFTILPDPEEEAALATPV